MLVWMYTKFVSPQHQQSVIKKIPQLSVQLHQIGVIETMRNTM